MSVTNDIRADLSSNTVWFKDELGGSWWACNTLDESHQEERDSEVAHVWYYTIEDNLNELIDTTYTNKMYIFFGSSLLKNFIIKRVWLKIIMRWMTF